MGATHHIVVASTSVAGTVAAPKRQVVAAQSPKLTPVTVTFVPPVIGPEVGWMAVTPAIRGDQGHLTRVEAHCITARGDQGHRVR